MWQWGLRNGPGPIGTLEIHILNKSPYEASFIMENGKIHSTMTISDADWFERSYLV